MATTTIDPDYRIKYKHLFRKTNLRTVSTIKDEIAIVLKHFNEIVDQKFYADNRILIPGTPNTLPRHGIIIEYQGKEEDFDNDFGQYLPRLEQLADKLGSMTSIYERPFKTEFCEKESWVDYNNTKVAYNLSM